MCRQECVLLPLLFNLYWEEVIQRALKETTTRVKVQGIPINHIHYADDTIFIAETIQDLQSLVDQIKNHCKISSVTGKGKYKYLWKDLRCGHIEGY